MTGQPPSPRAFTYASIAALVAGTALGLGIAGGQWWPIIPSALVLVGAVCSVWPGSWSRS
jgi:hypothetical protein